MKWKYFDAAYGSAAMVLDLVEVSGPKLAENLSRSMSTPARTCAMGSPVSDGLIVIQSEGGPIAAVKDHTLDWIPTLDSSVPITSE